jgi:ElaB/YqjD/DUF883 family membrane-anchored ribosome-binding protein
MDINDAQVLSSSRGRPSAGLAADYQRFVTDVEQLLKNGSHLSGESLAAVGRALDQRIAHAKARLADSGMTAAERIDRACDAARDYVQQRPLIAIAATALAAAAIGCAATILVQRR